MDLHVAKFSLGNKIHGVARGAVHDHALAGYEYELLRVGWVQRDIVDDAPGAGRRAPPGEVLAVKQRLSSFGAKSKGRSKSQHGCNDQQLATEGELAEGDCSHGQCIVSRR